MVEKDKVKSEKTNENKINPNTKKLKIITVLLLLLKVTITHNYLTESYIDFDLFKLSSCIKEILFSETNSILSYGPFFIMFLCT